MDIFGLIGEGERWEVDIGFFGVWKVGFKVWVYNFIIIVFIKDMKCDVFVFFVNDYW